MSFFNTLPAFFYRQLFITPPAPPSSVSLTGKVGLVTGSNTGLGYEASAQLLSLGLSHLILAVRNVSKGEAARESLLAAHDSKNTTAPTVEVWELDSSDYASMVNFVEKLNRSGLQLDFAILNAGVFRVGFEVNTATGNEEMIQTNWLSTGLLTLLLLPEMDQTARRNACRPVLSVVSSDTASWARFTEAQVVSSAEKENEGKEISLRGALKDEAISDVTDRYPTSKLLYQLFFNELMQKHRSAAKRSTGTILNIVNPGFCCGTEMHRNVTGVTATVFAMMKRFMGRSLFVGARTLIHGAVWAGPESNGKYLSDCQPAPFPDCLDSAWGKAMQTRVWDETVDEISKLLDVASVLEDI